VLHLNVSKVDRGVAHRMRVGSERGCKAVPARSLVARTTFGAVQACYWALARKSNVAGALARSLRGHRPTLAPRIG
jgi:hypothetical protein